jgi:hypothetical protein
MRFFVLQPIRISLALGAIRSSVIVSRRFDFHAVARICPEYSPLSQPLGRRMLKA